MRISQLVAKVEDKVIAGTPVVKAKAQHAATQSRSWLSRTLAKASAAVAPTVPSTPVDTTQC